MSRRRSILTVLDQFCGAGGSSIGAVAAGAEIRLAMNHWRMAIDTHSANFRDADHVCADISSTDPRRFVPTDILITSPECTNHSLAKSKPRALPLFDEPDEAADRSRATMHDVPRFAEHHRYKIIIVENVVEALRWPPIGGWFMQMDALGYRHRIVSLNSFAAPPTPQSRDRIYIVFWRKGNRAPDLDIRIPSWCPTCEKLVHGYQSFKNGTKPWGKYGRRMQYVYRCETCRSEAFPMVAPASTAIDWALKGERIGDRARPLKPATIRRIEEGLRRYARPLLAQVGGHSFERPGYVRAWPTDSSPIPAQLGTPHHGLVVPAGGTWKRGASSTAEPLPTTMPRDTHGLLVPLSHGNDPAGVRARPTSEPSGAQTGRQDVAFVAPLRTNGVARGVDEPLPAFCAGGTHHGLVVSMREGGASRTAPTSQPLGTVVAAGVTQALIMGNRTGGKARPAEAGPAPTICTGESVALIFGAYGGNTADGGTRPVTDPITPITAHDHHALLVPYYGTGVARPVTDPAGTVTATDRHALLDAGPYNPRDLDDFEPPAVEDCSFRMLEPHEIQAAMAFPVGYIVLGNKRERVRQLGNAVTPPVMSELLRRCVASLDGAR